MITKQQNLFSVVQTLYFHGLVFSVFFSVLLMKAKTFSSWWWKKDEKEINMMREKYEQRLPIYNGRSSKVQFSLLHS